MNVSAHSRESGNLATKAVGAAATLGPRLRGDERGLSLRIPFIGRQSELHLWRLADGLALVAEIEEVLRRKTERRGE